MAETRIHDRGRGPEIVGTRITVYNLLPHFLDPLSTEGQVCEWYELTPQQVAVARAYVLAHYDEVMAEHRRIEERLSAANTPAVLEETRLVRGRLKSFKEWVAEKNTAGRAAEQDGVRFPTFREWLAGREGSNGSSEEA